MEVAGQMTPLFRRTYSLLLLALILLAGPLTGATTAEYVGRESCANCHAAEVTAWEKSHHDLAMQIANADTVLGDFDNVDFTHFGITSHFYRDGDRFMVRTDGPDGALTDFRIDYTFGVHPLQQYLIRFTDGRLQALDIAWDSRPADQGGQRWFHLHPDDAVTHEDVLHWTGPALNWNQRCADCHSTNLRKGYDVSTDRYDTRWAEIDVSCEACHGPGSKHVEWAANSGEQSGPDGAGDRGLTVRFDERKGIRWLPDDNGGITRSEPRQTAKEITVCARCHSRRSQLTDAVTPGDPLLDAFRPALLSEGLYHADGQIRDEVYVWGSFVQSKMYQAGVTCSDCHDPHTTRLRQPGDQVCTQCHAPARYATPDHHFHDAKSAGASCVACHMPATTYMQVDPRRDHSLRVPRPDLSVVLGTPNACNQCHSDQSADWAASKLQDWIGRPPRGLQRYAGVLTAARQRLPDAAPDLQALAQDRSQPAIARATALASLDRYADQQTLMLLQQVLNGGTGIERLGALQAMESTTPQARVLAFPLLWDDLKAVRITAARLLAGMPSGRLSAEHQARLAQAVDEYIAVQRFNGSQPESQVNLGGLYTDLGRHEDAEQAYRKALALQPRFVPAYINYAQFLSDRQREQAAADLLKSGLAKIPGQATLEHALGLSLIRQKQLDQALGWLEKAARHEPAIPRYAYVYAVALESRGNLGQALEVLGTAHERHPTDVEILHTLVLYNRDAGRLAEARRYVTQLQALLPGVPAVEKLARELNSSP